MIRALLRRLFAEELTEQYTAGFDAARAVMSGMQDAIAKLHMELAVERLKALNAQAIGMKEGAAEAFAAVERAIRARDGKDYAQPDDLEEAKRRLVH